MDKNAEDISEAEQHLDDIDKSLDASDLEDSEKVCSRRNSCFTFPLFPIFPLLIHPIRNFITYLFTDNQEALIAEREDKENFLVKARDMKDDMEQALSDLEQVLEQKKIETQDLEGKLVQTDGESFHTSLSTDFELEVLLRQNWNFHAYTPVFNLIWYHCVT